MSSWSALTGTWVILLWKTSWVSSLTLPRFNLSSPDKGQRRQRSKRWGEPEAGHTQASFGFPSADSITLSLYWVSMKLKTGGVSDTHPCGMPLNISVSISDDGTYPVLIFTRQKWISLQWSSSKLSFLTSKSLCFENYHHQFCQDSVENWSFYDESVCLHWQIYRNILLDNQIKKWIFLKIT